MKWYPAHNFTPLDQYSIQNVPDPGDYTDLNDGDYCFVEWNGQLMFYQYSSSSSATEAIPYVVTPDGNAGNGRWLIKDIYLKDQNGFDVQQGPPTDSTISFTDGTRTFSIQPTGSEFYYYIKGVKMESTGDTVVITDVEGLHWIYFDDDGDLKVQAPGGNTDNLILTKCLVGNVYWDAVNNEGILVGEERHGSNMSAATHYHLHETTGAQYESGLSLANFDIDGSGADATAAQFDVTDGEIHDEDIEIEIENGSPQQLVNATIPTFYKLGVGGLWRKLDPVTNFPVADGTIGLRLDWNDYNGGTWQLQEVGNLQYVLTHYFATNDINHPIIGVMGENTYTNANQARTGAEVELLSISLSGLPGAEYIPIATVIWQTADSFSNAVAARLISTDLGDDYIDWRESQLFGSGGSTAADHESLANLYGGGANDHFHLTEVQHDDLTDGGNTVLHDHISLIDDGEAGATYTKDGALQLFWNAILEGQTLSGAFKAVNAFVIGSTVQVDAILDEDDMASDSATALATQQSIRAYVRDNAGDPGLPKLDFYQDWLQESKYVNGTAITMVDATTLTSVGNTTMDFNIEEKRWDFTAGEVFESTNLYDSDLSMTSITEAIMHYKSVDSGTPVIQITSDGGSNWETVTDLTEIVTFGTPGLDLRVRYTAGGTGYLIHMGALYNPSEVYGQIPQPNKLYYEGVSHAEAVAAGVNITGDLDVSDDITVTDDITLGGLLTVNGGQIKFPATQVPSTDVNTLDDYEEGTFSITVWDAASGGNQASTGTATGTYTKIGREVILSGTVSNIDTTGMTATNNLYFRGLPFTASSTVRTGSPRLSLFDFTGYVVTRTGSGTDMQLWDCPSGGGIAPIKVQDVNSSGSDVVFDHVYSI